MFRLRGPAAAGLLTLVGLILVANRTLMIASPALFVIRERFHLRAQESSDNKGSDNKASDEEYEIYSAMIKELYVTPASKLLTIEERTFRYDFSGGDDQPWRDKPKGLPIDESAVQDYESKNRGQTLLNKASFKLPVKSELVTDADLRTIFHGHWGELEWTEYYRRFPASDGFIMLSRVGFNTAHTQALLYTGSRSGPGYGEIHFIVLEKVNGTWSIKKQLRKNKFG